MDTGEDKDTPKSGQSHRLSHVRIVLLGYRHAGKTSTGNTILAKNAFKADRHVQCDEAMVAGRKVSVVDTPSWWAHLGLEDTPEMTKRAIVSSVSACSPGPHAFIVVLPIDKSFTDRHKRSVVEHLMLLGERIWNHTLVLFTQGDKLAGKTIEKHIESEGKVLEWLVEKCGHRYHVFKNRNRDTSTQVNKLLEKIEKMVAGSNDCHYKTDRQRICEVEEKRRVEDEMAKKRMEKAMEMMKSNTGAPMDVSELRIVLVGYRNAGKSSVGNTIFGRAEFGSKQAIKCVTRRGKTSGIHVTLVEAPGWKANIALERSPLLIKRELERSITLCAPEPHVILLVIDVDKSFKERHRRAVQEHLELLSEKVWNHTIVLFSCSLSLGDSTIEHHIESEGKALRWIVGNCGNRYHALNNKDWGDGTQVKELLEKIQKMVSGNSSSHYKIDKKRAADMEKLKTELEERAAKRRKIVLRENETLMSNRRDSPHLSQVRIVLLGYRGSGKSSSGNIIIGREQFDPVGRTAQCEKREEEISGRQVTVVDTPGWGCDVTIENAPERTKREILLGMSLCPPGPHALLLVVRVENSVTEKRKKTIEEYVELLNEGAWDHTIVLFTYGEYLGDTTIEEFIESEGKPLQTLVEKCGNRYHVFKHKNRRNVTELLEKIEDMVAKNNGRVYTADKDRLEVMNQKREEEGKKACERMRSVQNKRKNSKSLMGKSDHPRPLRMVMLGYRPAGKSSSGNTILGREEFDTEQRAAQCEMKQAEVAGRHVTVVDTTGWLPCHTLDCSPALTKREVVLSASMCPPGPHAFILVIDVDQSFTENHRRAAEQHLQLLSEDVWKHIIVLFTSGDCLGKATVEQYIESEGEALRGLIDKCCNRYHVFNNKNRGDATQVTELLEKIDEMVADNSGHHFEVDSEVMQQMEIKMKAEEEKVDERQMRVYKQKSTFTFVIGKSFHLPELRIVLLGLKGAGKSSAGNTILGREEFESVGRGTLRERRQVSGCDVTVVITEGWSASIHQEDYLKLTAGSKNEILQSVSQCRPGPHAFILVIRVDQSVNEEKRSTAQEHLECLGVRVWNHTIVLFTYGDWLGEKTIEQHIESEGKSLQWLIEKCRNRYHVFNTKNRGDGSQVKELLEKIEVMVAGGSGYYGELDDNQTIPDFMPDWSQKSTGTSEANAKSCQTPPNMGKEDRSVGQEDSSGYRTKEFASVPSASFSPRRSIYSADSGL
ncbi:GTPase IMAP family member 8-like [Denticeps clupeoides]|uniref:GTPase IMAP family member 8-like n=1 Tax=Denticeps clupeoides TaxID=299321 RepID=UPI0010A41816|nr:GTPase IMAP family member 8-like [Denticeps clupeoides]